MTASCYRPSGRVSPRLLGWSVLAAIALFPLARGYNWLQTSLAFLHLHLLLAAAFGVVCALVCAMVAECGKARSPLIAALAGAGIGLCAWLAASDTGAGVARWLPELLMLVVLPAGAAAQQALHPFCEVSGSWARRQLVPLKFGPVPDDAAWRARLAAEPAALFDRLDGLPRRAPGLSSLSLYVCPARNHAYATIVNTVVAIEDGGESRRSQTVVKHLRVDCALAEAALRRWQAEPGSALLHTDSAEAEAMSGP